jgi:methylisocitrate lyase
MTQATRAGALRARLAQPGILVLPGCADALTARMVQEAGFEAVYVTGAGFANAALGIPDLGLTTMTEVVSQAQRVADAVEIPVVVDADTGYGGALNVVRTVRELERAGAAAIQLEDQVSPKRCGHFEGTEVVEVEEMLVRIEAAKHARRDPDLVLIARTDARACEGYDQAVARARAYHAAGADLIFVEAPRTVDELRALPKDVRAPLLVNVVEGGKTPQLTAAEYEEMGFKVALFANTALRAAAKAVQDAMAALKREGSSASILDRLVPWPERQRLVDLDSYLTLDRTLLDRARRP